MLILQEYQHSTSAPDADIHRKPSSNDPDKAFKEHQHWTLLRQEMC